MELIILSIVGSLGALLLHLLEFISYPSDHTLSAVISPQTRSAGAAELHAKPRGAAFRQRLQDQKACDSFARYAEALAPVISEELRDQNHGRKESVARRDSARRLTTGDQLPRQLCNWDFPATARILPCPQRGEVS